MKLYIYKKQGFTLIELLVVISIIGVLAGIVLVSFTSSQKQARDVERKSDLKQYQTALESYANGHEGLFPSEDSEAVQSIMDVCDDRLSIDTCPEDPRYDSGTGEPYYKYLTPGYIEVSGDKMSVDYVIWAELESKDGYWVVCSDGKSGETVVEPTNSCNI